MAPSELILFLSYINKYTKIKLYNLFILQPQYVLDNNYELNTVLSIWVDQSER